MKRRTFVGLGSAAVVLAAGGAWLLFRRPGATDSTDNVTEDGVPIAPDGRPVFPEAYRQIYIYANPFVGILEGIRRPIHDGLPPNWEALAVSALWALIILLFGRVFFLRLQHDAVRML